MFQNGLSDYYGGDSLYNSALIWTTIFTFLLLAYLGLELWFSTALINSSTINADLNGNSYHNLGVLVTTVGISVNLMLWIFRSRYSKKDGFYPKSLFVFIAIVVLYFGINFRLVHFSPYYENVITFAVLSVLIFLMVKYHIVAQIFLPPLFLCILVLSIFPIVKYSINKLVENSPTRLVFCSVAGEVASRYDEEGHMVLHSDWGSEKSFQTIEGYQLDKRFISFASCQNLEFLKSILASSYFKERVKQKVYKSNNVSNDIYQFKKIKSEFNALYRDYRKLASLKYGWMRSTGYKRFMKGAREREISDPKKLWYAMRLYTCTPEGRNCGGFYGPLLTKPQLFSQIMDHYMGKKLSISTTEQQFKKIIFGDVFDKEYKQTVKTGDLSVFNKYKRELMEDYESIGKVKLAIFFSGASFLLSLGSFIAFFSTWAMKRYLQFGCKIHCLINPVTVALGLFLLANSSLTQTSFYKERIDKNSYFEISKYVLTLHAISYAPLKLAFEEWGFPAWLDTYAKDFKTESIKDNFNQAFAKKKYTTPVKESALFYAEQLHHLGLYDAETDQKMSRILDFYRSRSLAERAAYIQRKQQQFNTRII